MIWDYNSDDKCHFSTRDPLRISIYHSAAHNTANLINDINTFKIMYTPKNKTKRNITTLNAHAFEMSLWRLVQIQTLGLYSEAILLLIIEHDFK